MGHFHIERGAKGKNYFFWLPIVVDVPCLGYDYVFSVIFVYTFNIDKIRVLRKCDTYGNPIFASFLHQLCQINSQSNRND